jgi:hypothetical protein
MQAAFDDNTIKRRKRTNPLVDKSPVVYFVSIYKRDSVSGAVESKVGVVMVVHDGWLPVSNFLKAWMIWVTWPWPVAAAIRSLSMTFAKRDSITGSRKALDSRLFVLGNLKGGRKNTLRSGRMRRRGRPLFSEDPGGPKRKRIKLW